MDRRIVIVSISVGTAALLLGLVGILAFAIVFVHRSSSQKYPHSLPTSQPIIPIHRHPVGSLSVEETREKALAEQYGPVNTSKLKEDKNGLVNRIRSRVISNRCQTTAYVSRFYCTPPVEYVAAVTPHIPSIAVVSNGYAWNHSYSLPVVVPNVTLPSDSVPRRGENYREIDPGTCDGNSCALKTVNLIQSFYEGPFE